MKIPLGTGVRFWVSSATALALATTASPALAQRSPSDTATDSAGKSSQTAPPLISRRDLTMLAGAAVATAAVAPFDHCIQHNIRTEDLRNNLGLRRVANTFAFVGGPGPFVFGGALYLAGQSTGSKRLDTLGVTVTEAVVVAAALNGLVKGFSGRALPNATSAEPGEFSFGRGFHDGNGAFVSFPSGHTAASFAMATVIAEEASAWNATAGRVVAPVAYSTATLVALSRLYENLHWASDLPLGAAIGVVSGKAVVRWQRRHPDNWLARQLLGVNVVPDAHGVTVSASLALHDR